MNEMNENMTVIATLARLAAAEKKSYGQYVAGADPAELARCVRGIKLARRRRRGARFFTLKREGERA